MEMDIRCLTAAQRWCLWAALGLALQLAGGALAQSKKPPHRFDWKRLLPAGNQRLPVEERTRVALECIREEVVNPTEPYFTEHDHASMLWNIVEYLAHPSGRGGLNLARIRAARTASRIPEERDVLLLLLGTLGDASVKQEVTAYLLDTQKPGRLRMLAATALGTIRDPASIDILLRVAETDKATEVRARLSTVGHQSSRQRVYLVREAASIALVRFDQDLLLSEEAKARHKAIQVAAD
jgi:hypothetical protein